LTKSPSELSRRLINAKWRGPTSPPPIEPGKAAPYAALRPLHPSGTSRGCYARDTLRVRCATRWTPQSPFEEQVYALTKTVHPALFAGQVHLQPAQVQAGGTPGRTGFRQAAGYPLRCVPHPSPFTLPPCPLRGPSAGTFGGDLRRGPSAGTFGGDLRRGPSAGTQRPPSPFSSKMERESPPLPLSHSVRRPGLEYFVVLDLCRFWKNIINYAIYRVNKEFSEMSVLSPTKLWRIPRKVGILCEM
jgi:hypothetical protein